MENRNISIAKVNGYTFEKVMKAKQYLDEIGSNKRNFPFDRLVKMYNDVLGTNESPSGCKCQSPKYFNGIQNFYKFGKLTLINNGIATEEDFAKKEEKPQPIENAENRIDLGSVEAVPEDKVEDTKEDEDKASDEAKKVGKKKKNG